MSDFQGCEDILQDFLVEAADMLAGVDNKLVELEKAPGDRALLNDIFRGFHTIKGGAGFLSAAELVTLCHLTENLFDRLRNGELDITPECMDVVLNAAAAVHEMFTPMRHGSQPEPASPLLIEQLQLAIAGALPCARPVVSPTPLATPERTGDDKGISRPIDEPDWDGLFRALTGAACASPVSEAQAATAGQAGTGTRATEASAEPHPFGRRASDRPGFQGNAGRRDGERSRDNSIRVDTTRLDQVLNLSGEIGLTKNRLTSLRTEILNGATDTEALQALDAAVGQLDLLVSDLQNAVMKTRMQPIGRLFQKYPRIARDLARSLGKDVELVLAGEETEIDKTMIEDLSDPIIHLIRNAVDHGIESPAERAAAGKPHKSEVRLEARQEGDHIIILVSDDGRGMSPERLRAKALEKRLISAEDANTLDERQSLNLVFLPGFSTKSEVSDVSGRGVGMDVVRTNIQKLSGTIDIRSRLGEGTAFVISLPLTLAILPVLLVRLGDQPFAVPLSLVREILPIEPAQIQEVGGRATMAVRGEILPVLPLAHLLGWAHDRAPEYGVLMQTAETAFILAIDSFAGRDDAVIKSLDDFKPKGVAGVTTLSNGEIVLILDIKELLGAAGNQVGVPRRTVVPELAFAA